MDKEEIERLASLETKIDMHLAECGKRFDYTSNAINDIHNKISNIQDNLTISLNQQQIHLQEHKEHSQNIFKMKLALFGVAIASIFSFLFNLLI